MEPLSRRRRARAPGPSRGPPRRHAYELVDTFLDRHGKVAQPTTIATLRNRMKRPLDDFGDTTLVDLERMTDEVAGFAASLPDRFRYSVMSAFRQTCAAGIRYGYMTMNPAKLAGKNREAAEPR